MSKKSWPSLYSKLLWGVFILGYSLKIGQDFLDIQSYTPREPQQAFFIAEIFAPAVCDYTWFCSRGSEQTVRMPSRKICKSKEQISGPGEHHGIP